MRRVRAGTVLAGAVVALAACGGGTGALAPLKDAPTAAPRSVAQVPMTTATTVVDPLEALRVRLERFLAVPDPVGFRLESAAEDRDTGSLAVGLDEEFAGKGFVHGLIQYWVDGSGRRLDLAVYAFTTADGARRAWSCGCPGPPIAGVPDSSVVVSDGTVSAAAAVNQYVVHTYSEVPASEGGASLARRLLLDARARILGG